MAEKIGLSIDDFSKLAGVNNMRVYRALDKLPGGRGLHTFTVRNDANRRYSKIKASSFRDLIDVIDPDDYHRQLVLDWLEEHYDAEPLSGDVVDDTDSEPKAEQSFYEDSRKADSARENESAEEYRQANEVAIDVLRQAAATANASLDSLNAQLEYLKTIISAKDQDIQTLKADLVQRDLDLKNLNEKMLSYSDQLGDLRVEQANMRSEQKSKEALIESQKESLSEKEQTIRQLKAEQGDPAYKSLQQEKDVLRTKNETLSQENETLSQEKEALRQKNREYSDLANQRGSLINQRNQELEQLRKQLQEAQNAAAQSEAARKKAENKLVEIQDLGFFGFQKKKKEILERED